MKRFKAGSVPLAFAVSIIAHVVLFGAFQARNLKNPPEQVRFEVTIEYVAPVESPPEPVREEPKGRARPVPTRDELPSWETPRYGETVLTLLPVELPEAWKAPAADSLIEETEDPVPEEGGFLVAIADERMMDPTESQGPSRLAERVETRESLSPPEYKEPGSVSGAPGGGSRTIETGGGETAVRGETAASRTRLNLDRINEELSRRIDRRKVYPPAARKRGIQGTVVCRLEVDRRGNLIGLNVVVSSGSRVLDDAAVNLLEGVFPISNLSGMELTLEKAVRYNLVE